MKQALVVALFATLASATTFAGADPVRCVHAPDGGASILLMGIAVAGLGLFRKIKQ